MTKHELKLSLEHEQSRITGKVCKALSVPEEQVRGHCRKKEVVEARNVVWLYLRKSSERRFKMAWIANAFKRKQSTVLHGVRKANAWVGCRGEAKRRPELCEKLSPYHKELLGNDK